MPSVQDVVTILVVEDEEALSLRPNRMTPDEACPLMERLAGTAIDPEVYRALATVLARRQALEFLPDEESGEHHAEVGLPPAKALLRRREGNQAGR